MLKPGQEITHWDTNGHAHFGTVESEIMLFAGQKCVKIDGKWVNIDFVSVDGKTAEIMKERHGRMRKNTGGTFGAWKLDGEWAGISDWTYDAPAFIRYYRFKGVNEQIAVYVNPRPKHHLFRVYTPYGEMFDMGYMYNLNKCGQHACDMLREYLLKEITGKAEEELKKSRSSD